MESYLWYGYIVIQDIQFRISNPIVMAGFQI